MNDAPVDECATGLAYADVYGAAEQSLVAALLREELARTPKETPKAAHAEDDSSSSTWLAGTALASTVAELEARGETVPVREPLDVGRGMDEEQRAAVLLEFELVRAENLLLLKTFGDEVWAQFADAAAATQRRLEDAAAAARKEVAAVNAQRAVEQQRAYTELRELHSLFLAEVRKNARIQQCLDAPSQQSV